MIVFGFSILIFGLLVFLLAGKKGSVNIPKAEKSNGIMSSEPVQKRGSNLYTKSMEDYNQVELDHLESK